MRFPFRSPKEIPVIESWITRAPVPHPETLFGVDLRTRQQFVQLRPWLDPIFIPMTVLYHFEHIIRKTKGRG